MRLWLCAAFLLVGAAPAPPASLPKIGSAEEFERLASPAPAPLAGQLLFLIDLDEGARVYFLDTRRYARHHEFLAEAYLAPRRGLALDNNSDASSPRFVVGLIGRFESGGYGFEVWNNEGFRSGAIGLAQVPEILGRVFFTPLQPLVSGGGPAVSGREGYRPLSGGKIAGRVRLARTLAEARDVRRWELLVLDEVPSEMPDAGALILLRPLSPLAHLALLAQGLGIPLMTLDSSQRGRLAAWDGRWASLEIGARDFELSAASSAEVRLAKARPAPRREIWLPSDLEHRDLTPLAEQRGVDYIRFGSKSANLGELVHSAIGGLRVPRGVTIPFRHYADFIRTNGLDREIAALLADPRVRTNPSKRHASLRALRKKFDAGRIPDELARALSETLARDYAGAGLFVRSSSNSEDLPFFTGAGLYTTVPNARGLEATLAAVKKVWGSVWNDAAFEARDRLEIKHQSAQMAVLLQDSVAADAAGVALAGAGESAERPLVRIAAKQGLGIRVVGGGAPPEEMLYDGAAGSVETLRRSEDLARLVIDKAGGVREEPASTKPPLDAEQVKTLGRLSLEIQALFGGAPQDIEWVIKDGEFWIVQSRPFKGKPPVN